MKHQYHLYPDETVVYRTYIHPVLFVPTIILGIVLYFFCSSEHLETIPHLTAIALPLFVLSIIPQVIDFVFADLHITKKRVQGRRGAFSIRQMDAPLNKINTVTISQTLFGAIFNYGTIHISTSSEDYHFSYISKPTDFRNALLASIENLDSPMPPEAVQYYIPEQHFRNPYSDLSGDRDLRKTTIRKGKKE